MLTICTQYLKYINRETYRSFKKKLKKVISGPAIERPSNLNTYAKIINFL